MSLRHKKERGFTLVETVTYLGILSVILVLVIGTMVSLNSSVVSMKVSRNLNRGAAFALERILRDTKDAIAIDTGVVEPEYLGEISEALAIKSRDNGDMITARYYLSSDDRLMMKRGGGAERALTSGNMVVRDLSFTKLASANTETVRVYLRISDRNDQAESSRDHYGSAVLRGGY